MAEFEDLDEYFDPGLTLTVNGRRYQVPLPTAELGLWCQRIAAAAGQVDDTSTDDEMAEAVAKVEALPALPGDLSLAERTLGQLHQVMVDDGVEWPKIQFCGQTAYVWIVGGELAAERFWRSGGRPEALARPNRDTRRAGTRKTGTAAASGTPRQGSTSGTRPRPKSSGRGKAAKSPGSRS